MRVTTVRRIQHWFPAFVLLAVLAGLCASARAQDDPPPQAGRLSGLQGDVFIQPAGSDNFGQAYPNLPLGPGDRIVTDNASRAEIQLGRTWVRLGPNADATLVDFNADAITFGVAAGAVRVHCDGLWEGQVLYVQTPSGNATISDRGDFRVDVLPDNSASIVTDNFGPVYISGANDFGVETEPGQALELVGTNPVYPQWLEPAPLDDLDHWSQNRDADFVRAVSYRYVSPEIAGAYELDAAGDWMPQSDYGPVWFPRVDAGWAPYRHGHWINRPPWGWVWVEEEPWGDAPFHYGRWVTINGRWGWIPGPPAVHPVWSPALVVFAGGSPGVSVWFPLGPGEPYRPWYHCSPAYIDQVNITNITPAPRVVVQRTYVNIVNVNITNITYVNRTVGYTAVRQEDMAAGRPAARVSVNIDIHLVEHPQVLAAPAVQPSRTVMIAPPPSHAVRVAVARPVLINAQGKAVAAQPHAQPAPPPVRQVAAPKPLPGRKVVAQPASARIVPPSQHLTASGKPNHAPEAPAAPSAAAEKPAPQPKPQAAPPAKASAPAQPKPAPPAAETKPVQAEKPAPPPAPKPEAKPTPKPESVAAHPAPEAKPAPQAPARSTTEAKPAPAPANPAAKPAPKPGEKKPADDKNKKPEDKQPE